MCVLSQPDLVFHLASHAAECTLFACIIRVYLFFVFFVNGLRHARAGFTNCADSFGDMARLEAGLDYVTLQGSGLDGIDGF
ncbi:hypothetical protein PG987_005785 [Apiospora arundinis]